MLGHHQLYSKLISHSVYLELKPHSWALDGGNPFAYLPSPLLCWISQFNISRSLGFSPKFILVPTVLIFMNSIFNYPKDHCYSVMSKSLLPYGVQHTRPPCSSPSPRACSNSHPLISDAIQPSSSVIPFSLCPKSFPASGSFLMSQL